jgi:hypothetical protein
MSWKTYLKEKVVDAARRIANSLQTLLFGAVPFLVSVLFILRRVRAR